MNTGYQTGRNNQLSSDGTYTYTYDDEGNLISRTEIATGDMREFAWDHRNRLVAVRDKESNIETQRVEYTYDVMGRRIGKIVDSDGDSLTTATTTRFVYDGDNVLLEFDGSSSSIPGTRYLQGPNVDQVLAQESGSNTVWHLADHLGTIHDLVDNNGAVVNHYTYDSFGNIASSTAGATVDTRYKFTGREFDTEIELYYYRARYYDANVGRFIGEDPLGFNGDGPNLHTYVLNHPVDRVDPYGERAILKKSQRTITYVDSSGQDQTVFHIDHVKRARNNGKFSYVRSDVTTATLIGSNGRGSGSSVSPGARAQVPDLRARLDNAGHIIGSQLGGSGKDHNNLFSQEANRNQGHKGHFNEWRGYEDTIADMIKPPGGRSSKGCSCTSNSGLEADMTVKLWYERPLSNGAPRSLALRPMYITSFTKFRVPVNIFWSRNNAQRLGAIPLPGTTISANLRNPK